MEKALIVLIPIKDYTTSALNKGWKFRFGQIGASKNFKYRIKDTVIKKLNIVNAPNKTMKKALKLYASCGAFDPQYVKLADLHQLVKKRGLMVKSTS